MENVEIISDEVRFLPKNFNLSEYMNSTFAMFSGETQEVKLRFHCSLVNAVIDRFGKNITLRPDGNEHFTIRVNVKAEPPFKARMAFCYGPLGEQIEFFQEMK